MHKANNTSLPAHENTRAAASQPVQQVTHAPSPLQSAVETGDEEQEAPPALSTVYAPLQFKLTANTPGDHYEQEAEQIAETVVSGAQSPSIQRAAAPDVKAEEDEKKLRPKGLVQFKVSSDSPEAPIHAGLENRIEGARGSGMPLSEDVQANMEDAFGTDFSGVRIHTNTEADTLNRSLDARAFTTGQDVFFRSGEYTPNSPEGTRLLAHELTHVVQQGGSNALQSKRIQRFKQGDDEHRGGHAWMTSQTLQHQMGLSRHEAHMGRMGNWERDYSQLLTPGVVMNILGSARLMKIGQILALSEFGRGLDPAEFGTYDPVEHMDNPAGLRADGIYQQGNFFRGSATSSPANPDQHGHLVYQGRHDQAYADQDSRYQETPGIGSRILNPLDARAFQVDESGIPVYMYTSREWYRRMLKGAARYGRRRSGGRGPRDFAGGSHVMQDYYAHSNFVEIAINILIRSGQLTRVGGQSISSSRVLDTQVHANDAQGNPVAPNLTHAGREVMSTGTFNLTDTMASLLGEVKDKLISLNPFAGNSSGPSPLVRACLDYLDMTAPDSFNQTGNTLADLFDPFIQTISATTNAGASGISTAGEIGASALSGLGEFAAAGLDFVGDHTSLAGGILDQSADAVRSHSQQAAGAISSGSTQLSQPLQAVSQYLQTFSRNLRQREHLLNTAYQSLCGIDFLAIPKAAARRIPVVGERIAQMIQDFQTRLNTLIRQMFSRLWNQSVDQTVALIDRAIDALGRSSNTHDHRDDVAEFYDAQGRHPIMNPSGRHSGIAPDAYTPPSHTQVAKDHSDMQTSIPDGHRDEDGQDTHGHTHISSWLNPIAETLAYQATQAIGIVVARCWDKVDRNQALDAADDAAIDQVLDTWFRHPQDCQSLWQTLLLEQMDTPRFSAELLRRLASQRHSRADALRSTR